MKIYLRFENSPNYLVTIATSDYYNFWKKYCLPSWKLYCKKNNLGLICFNKELIDYNNVYYKKPTWQRLLIAYQLKKYKFIKNLCFLDADIIINPFSPNIFNFYKNKKNFGIISADNNSNDKLIINKRISYFRRKFYSKNYPLNSIIFFSTKQFYHYAKLKDQKNLFCSGVFLCNIKNHYKMMKNWFYLYKKNVKSPTSGGDQTHFNFHVFSSKKFFFLNKKFQCIWTEEMAAYYPFLYNKPNKKIIINCITASLLNNFFIHFSGSWPESEMIKSKVFFKSKSEIKSFKKLYDYYKWNKKPKSYGLIKYKKKHSKPI